MAAFPNTSFFHYKRDCPSERHLFKAHRPSLFIVHQPRLRDHFLSPTLKNNLRGRGSELPVDGVYKQTPDAVKIILSSSRQGSFQV